jgi:hypothetical protein
MKRSSCQDREKIKENEKRQLRQTQSITEATATVQVHATSNSTNGESRAKTKGKATEDKKTGHPSLDGDEKNRPHQHAEEMELAPITHLTH